jgi:integrase
MASLMYGAGLRLLECAELRVKDIHLDRGEVTIRDGKVGKDRVTMLPAALKQPLVEHLSRIKAQHDADLAAGRGTVALPGALRASPMRRENGRGSGSFPRPVSIATRRPGSAAGITCTNPSSSAR